jgi:hypothetical protein
MAFCFPTASDPVREDEATLPLRWRASKARIVDFNVHERFLTVALQNKGYAAILSRLFKSEPGIWRNCS